MPKDKASIEQEALVAKQQKESEDLKNAARRLFSTKDGVTVARAMMNICQIYSLDIDTLDNDKVRSMVSRAFLYKLFIVGMLTPQQRMLIETKEEK